MKRIDLQSAFDIKAIFREYGCSLNSWVNMQIGYDGKIYMLLNSHIPERIDGMFVNTESNSGYAAIVLEVDWEDERVTKHSYYDFGVHEINFHMIQPIGEHILLLGARCRYREGNPEKNAKIIDFAGNTLKEYCLGDGIQDCIVKQDGDIITSYFDEGVFGNFGWDNPIGSCGLIVWDQNGEIKWKADRYICDCYAVNIDEQEKLWYYYYTDFELVQTDLQTEKVYKPQVNGASGFLLTADATSVVFDGGYEHHCEFAVERIMHDTLTDYEKLQFVFTGNELLIKSFCFRQSKAVFVDNRNRLFVKYFVSV